MKKLLLLLIAPLFLSNAKLCAESISFFEARKKGLISFECIGTGIYSGFAINLTVTNLTSKSLSLFIEPGRIMIPTDTIYQDILISRSAELMLAAKQTTSIEFYGFCARMHRSAPSSSTVFRMDSIVHNPLLKIAQYIDLHRKLDNSTAQHAIWVLSDNNPIESIMDDNKPEIFELKKLLAELTGKPIPWYSLSYAKDSTKLFSGRAANLNGNFEFYAQHYGLYTLVLQDKKRKTIAFVFKEKPFDPGKHTHNINMRVLGLPKGKYYYRLYRENTQVLEKEVDL